MIAVVGVGIAAAFYVPSYLDIDTAALVSAVLTLIVAALGGAVDPQVRRPVNDDSIVLNETIHQSTRLRIMTLLVSQPETGRLAYGFIQKTLGLTGGNLTTHLRRLEDAGYLTVRKEFQDLKPRTWLQATPAGRRAFADYVAKHKEGAEPAGRMGSRPGSSPGADGQANVLRNGCEERSGV